MAGIIVQKYGGSSVADADKIRFVAKRIAATRRQGKDVVVVVSAMGKTTNQLLEKAKEISKSPSRRELDMLLTCGERASMALLSMAVAEEGLESISLTGSQSGIITNNRHSGARIVEIRPFRVQDELEEGKVVIVAGFQGVSYKREVTTLGRGGSDITAVALAGALGAEYCEICSDVDGVYTADPRVVSAAQMLEAISHEEMLELAGHGAKVLHPECVEFARRSGVALYARATDKDGGGTRIDVETNVDLEQKVSGVAGQRSMIRVRATGATAAPRLLAVLAEATVSVQCVDLVDDSVELWFGLADVPDWLNVKTRLMAVLDELGGTMAEDGGAVTMVGRGIGSDPGLMLHALQIAKQADLQPYAMSTSPLRVSLYCEDRQVDDLVRLLHREFCE
jgi:aspartate kinase